MMAIIGIGIGTTEYYIDVPKLSCEKIQKYSESLFKKWASDVDSHLTMLPDYSLSLTVKEGSIIAIAKIITANKSLCSYSSKYDSFEEGIIDLELKVNRSSDFLKQCADETFKKSSNNKSTVKKQKEAPAKLREIFKKIRQEVRDHGYDEYILERAVSEVEAIWGSKIDKSMLKDMLKQTQPPPSHVNIEYANDGINQLKSKECSVQVQRKSKGGKLDIYCPKIGCSIRRSR